MPSWKLDKAKAMRGHSTYAESILWALLRGKRTGRKWRRQAPMFGYIADFWCPSAKVVVEADGGIHDSQKRHDAKRDQVLMNHGITTLRFKNSEILDDPDMVLEMIDRVCRGLPV